MTRKQALKRYDQILRQCFREMQGGLSFGMDWATLRITWPERYQEIVEIRRIVRETEQ